MIITVVGLGVVGGSFVKALKGQGHEVYGVDVDEETLARAKADGCIKEGFVDGREIIKKSDMTIICLYPSLVLDYIKNHEFKKGSIITDAVGVKTHFLNEAMDLLKDKDVEFVSGHPMAGRENKGYLYASKEVFQGANYILIQHEENSKSAIAMMTSTRVIPFLFLLFFFMSILLSISSDHICQVRIRKHNHPCRPSHSALQK